MPTIHLVCGKIASGKSTFSHQLSQENGGVVLSIDELMIELFGKSPSRQIFDTYLDRCKAWQRSHASRLVEQGVDVYLDWGFWKRKERQDIQGYFRAKEVETILHYLDTDISTRLSRLGKRNEMNPVSSYPIEQKDLDLFDRLFEEPSEGECFQSYRP